MYTAHHTAVMEDIRKLAVDFKRLAGAFKIPLATTIALEHKHRNTLDLWDAFLMLLLSG